jgi:hypothetical protein
MSFSSFGEARRSASGAKAAALNVVNSIAGDIV